MLCTKAASDYLSDNQKNDELKLCLPMHQPLREYKEFDSASIPLVTSVMWQCGGNEEVCF